MVRKIFIAALALACVTLVLPPALGDEGRDGGIVVLPAATMSLSVQRPTITTFVFQPGQDIRLRLPPELRKAVTLFEIEDVVVATGSVTGRTFSVDAEDIIALQASGVQLFRVFIVSEDMRSLILAFEILADGRVLVTVS